MYYLRSFEKFDQLLYSARKYLEHAKGDGTNDRTSRSNTSPNEYD